MKLLLLVGLSLALLSTAGPAAAGKIDGGFSGCDLGSFLSNCEWEPSYCSKPSAPISFVSDVASYNRAVDEFNFYIERVNRYLQCIIDEAKSDIGDKVPKMISDSVDELSRDVRRDVDDAKSDLERDRPSLR